MICFGTLQALCLQASISQAGATVVELTDEVPVAETVRPGVNLSGYTYYSGAIQHGVEFYLPNGCRSGQIILASRRSYVIDQVTRCDIRNTTCEIRKDVTV